ncbi:MAG TPA: PEGA domain-containing protein [Fibrobacteria bacterium]|nr:PEGA domain-containing protein [Fibrobacteria bacterium]
MEIRFATLVLASTRVLVPISALVSGLVLAPGSALSQERPNTATVATTPYLAPVPVRILPARPAGGCLDAAQAKIATDRLGPAAASTGAFVPSTQASNLLRLHMDLSDGICQVTVEFQGDDLRLEGKRLLAPGETLEGSKRLEQAVEELAGNWFKAKAATLTVVSQPAGAGVRMDGLQVGKAPAIFVHLRPGSVAVRVGLPGYADVSDTVFLDAGSSPRRDYTLRRTASGAGETSSGFARSRPGQSLPDLFARLIPSNLPEGRQTVAIFPFQVQGSSSPLGYDPGVMAAEYGVARYAKDPRFMVVERDGLNRILQEQSLGQSGALDDSGAVKAGKLLAARYIVTGTVRIQGPAQEFSARMVSVETGEVVSAAEASSASQNLEALYREALGERGQVAGALYRSAVGPGWGQFYTDHPVQGSIALGATAAALGWVGWTWVDYDGKNQTLAKFRNGDPSTVTPNETVDQWVAAAEHARSQNNRALSTFEFSLGILGAVWAANLLDAGVLGFEDSRRIRAEYFTWAPAVDPTGDGVRLSWRF